MLFLSSLLSASYWTNAGPGSWMLGVFSWQREVLTKIASADPQFVPPQTSLKWEWHPMVSFRDSCSALHKVETIVMCILVMNRFASRTACQPEYGRVWYLFKSLRRCVLATLLSTAGWGDYFFSHPVSHIQICRTLNTRRVNALILPAAVSMSFGVFVILHRRIGAEHHDYPTVPLNESQVDGLPGSVVAVRLLAGLPRCQKADAMRLAVVAVDGSVATLRRGAPLDLVGARLRGLVPLHGPPLHGCRSAPTRAQGTERTVRN